MRDARNFGTKFGSVRGIEKNVKVKLVTRKIVIGGARKCDVGHSGGLWWGIPFVTEVNPMFMKKFTGIVVGAGLLIAASTLILAGQGAMGAQEQSQKELKKVQMVHSKPDSGAQMFKDYCAVCHGVDGRGDGPAVEFLKVPPPSLRTLAKRSDGKYPESKVVGVLQFGSASKAHGTSDMPLWGPLFRSEGGHGIATLRVHNLTEHVKTLQDK